MDYISRTCHDLIDVHVTDSTKSAIYLKKEVDYMVARYEELKTMDVIDLPYSAKFDFVRRHKSLYLTLKKRLERGGKEGPTGEMTMAVAKNKSCAYDVRDELLTELVRGYV